LRHLLRTAAAPTAFRTGFESAEGWLREADAFCGAAGERLLQRRVRHDLAAIGAKVPRTGAAGVSPHLARLGITAREAEVLHLVNAGLGNLEIAERLFISARTVETHVSHLLQKTGNERREQLLSTVQPDPN
jgi:DNA-binding NarL/FixJ family response regulator